MSEVLLYCRTQQIPDHAPPPSPSRREAACFLLNTSGLCWAFPQTKREVRVEAKKGVWAEAGPSGYKKDLKKAKRAKLDVPCVHGPGFEPRTVGSSGHRSPD